MQNEKKYGIIVFRNDGQISDRFRYFKKAIKKGQ